MHKSTNQVYTINLCLNLPLDDRVIMSTYQPMTVRVRYLSYTHTRAHAHAYSIRIPIIPYGDYVLYV